MINKETAMIKHGDHIKQPQTTFIHHVFKIAIDEINTLSDSLMAIQPAKYDVEKDIVASLAVLLHRKIHDIRSLMEEMTRESRSFGLD